MASSVSFRRLKMAIKAMVKHAESKDDFLGVLNHFKPFLDEIRLPPGDKLVEYSQAEKDVARERFVVQGEEVEGFMLKGALRARLETVVPSSLPLAVTGGTLLWLGWFGFNAGSALSAGALATLVASNTQAGAVGAGMVWMGYSSVLHYRLSGRARLSLVAVINVRPLHLDPHLLNHPLNDPLNHPLNHVQWLGNEKSRPACRASSRGPRSCGSRWASTRA